MTESLELAISEIENIIRKSPDLALHKVDEIKSQLNSHSSLDLIHQIELLYFKCLLSSGKYNTLTTATKSYILNYGDKLTNDSYVNVKMLELMAYYQLVQIENFNLISAQCTERFNKVEDPQLKLKILTIQARGASINKDYLKTIEITKEALMLCELLDKNQVHQSSHLHTIATGYIDLKNYDEALKYLQQAAKILKGTSEHYSIILNLLNTARTYRLKNEINLSYSNIVKAEAYSKTYNFTLFNAFVYSEFAQLFFAKKDFETALAYCKDALYCFNKDAIKDSTYAEIKLLSFQCQIYFEDYFDIEYEGEAVANFIETLNNNELSVKLNTMLYELALKSNNKKKANEYLNKISAIK